ncbi:glycoside hydrolase family 1 protein [Sphingomonas populi]|uniref:Glycoside hydrolase family 1 protein n=1 Tax=Sphingomonas populi TaxID=2484750 RepID=A0A4Q6XUI4_9SPHN|nr:family 1 glycosylhydrolase [Sphingomonas populi]RZF61154.1 glycoside hydrolase family 1 protein [Sphingomonas populi]
MVTLTRRQFSAGAAMLGTAASMWPAAALAGRTRQFPDGFLWGAATSAYQIEGNNINSDVWQVEAIAGTPYAEPAGDAANGFELWPTDLDLAKAMGLNSYRFSLEWARIEPRAGEFSVAMLDHYKRIIEGCHARGLKPFVTFNHFTTPLWFALRGGWQHPDAPTLFARFCAMAASHLSDGIAVAATLNEPNLAGRLADVLPPAVSKWLLPADRAVSEKVAAAFGVPLFLTGNNVWYPDPTTLQANLLKGHDLGRQAIKAVRGDLPVGVCLAIIDDQAVGSNSIRDTVRKGLYVDWLQAARRDDFVGVQNYERALWDDKGRVPPPPEGDRNFAGGEVYSASLAGAVRYAYSVAKVPIFVTEHGVNSQDDTVRQRLIPAALGHLHRAIAEGVPVKGYMHWSLIDNFEWGFGYKPQFGLHSFDRKTFARTAKASAGVLGGIARANAV